MTAIRISIVMPSLNQGRFLPSTLDSILQQSHPPFEVIVVDGGSTDDTLRILEDYGRRHPQLQWISEKDSGPADAVNKGLARVQGDWIGICSSDDSYEPGAFAAVAATAASNPDSGFIYGDLRRMDEGGHALGEPSNYPAFDWEALFGLALCIHQGSIFFAAPLARATGSWNPRYFGCDLDYWMRLMFRTRPVKLTQSLSLWRNHDAQRTRPDRHARICRDYRRMIEESPDLRAAPPQLQRMARASCHVMALMYPPTPSLWAARWHLLAAFAGYPALLRHQPRERTAMLVPGYPTLRRIRRGLFGRPPRPRHEAWRDVRKPGLTQRLRDALAPHPRLFRAYLRVARHFEDQSLLGSPVQQVLAQFERDRVEVRFVQVGSNDADFGDPIMDFVLAGGWRGVMVEPVPYVFERLRRRHGRNPRLALENAAIGEVEGPRTFYCLEALDPPPSPYYDQMGSFSRQHIEKHERFLPELSQHIREIQVQCLSLASLLRRHGITRLDLLHVDAEGADFEVLRSLDFAACAPALILFEHGHLPRAQRQECESFLEARGYRLLYEGRDCLAFSDAARARLPWVAGRFDALAPEPE